MTTTKMVTIVATNGAYALVNNITYKVLEDTVGEALTVKEYMGIHLSAESKAWLDSDQYIFPDIDYINFYQFPLSKLSNVIQQNLERFERIFPGGWDGDYFDNVPDHFDQILQAISWLEDSREAATYLSQLNQTITDYVNSEEGKEDECWGEVEGTYTNLTPYKLGSCSQLGIIYDELFQD